LNSYLNLDTSKYIFRYNHPSTNIITEDEFETLEELKKFKEHLETDTPFLQFLMEEKEENTMLYEIELLKRFKSSLSSGFKYAIMPPNPLYADPKELIEFIYYNYNDDNFNVLYDMHHEFVNLVFKHCFDNVFSNPVETTHELLSLVLNYHKSENNYEYEFFKYFLMIYNEPLNHPHSINIQLLFNDILGLKHEYESKGEEVPLKLKTFCDLI